LRWVQGFEFLKMAAMALAYGQVNASFGKKGEALQAIKAHRDRLNKVGTTGLFSVECSRALRRARGSADLAKTQPGPKTN
jgi:hypothetical protein